MTIQRVERIVYGVEDMDAGARYYRDWGLKEVESGSQRALFRTRSNQTIELRPADDPSLPPSPDPAGSTVRAVVWGVADEAGLKQLGEAVGTDRDVMISARQAGISRVRRSIQSLRKVEDWK